MVGAAQRWSVAVVARGTGAWNNVCKRLARWQRRGVWAEVQAHVMREPDQPFKGGLNRLINRYLYCLLLRWPCFYAGPRRSFGFSDEVSGLPNQGLSPGNA